MKTWHIFQEICIFIKKQKNITIIFLTKLRIKVTYIYQIFIIMISVITWLVLFLRFQNLLTPKGNLLNGTTPEAINLFSSNVFKLSAENLGKTVIENYIKKVTVGFINESYFLYNKSNVIEQTFVTEINKLISVYGSIRFFNKKV